MSNFYGRRWAIDIDGQPFIDPLPGPVALNSRNNESLVIPRDFRITFEASVGPGEQIPYLDLRIWGLNNTSISELLGSTPQGNNDGRVITLAAGYIDNFGVIFSGRIRNVFLEYEPPSRVIRVIAAGGAVQRASKRLLNLTLPESSTVVDALDQCAKSLGLQLVVNPQLFSSAAPFIFGRKLHADAKKELDLLAREFSFQYTIAGDELIIGTPGIGRDNNAKLISYTTGMEGVPEITEVGCDVNVRMSPDIKMGDRIDIKSELKTFEFNSLYFQQVSANAGSGIYVVHHLKYSGDSWGNNWTMNIEGIREAATLGRDFQIRI